MAGRTRHLLALSYRDQAGPRWGHYLPVFLRKQALVYRHLNRTARVHPRRCQCCCSLVS